MTDLTIEPGDADCQRCNADRPFAERMLRGMIVCPECGNKRCPKASDHTLACTGSNEPGQPGSVYGGLPPEAS